jgi:uncharacterized membrane protein YGL010W
VKALKSLADQVSSYAAYHHDLRNKVTHFIGVPLVIFSLLLFLGWFRFIHADISFTAATLLVLGVFVYYLALDWQVALLQAPFSLGLLWLADRAAILPFSRSLAIFAVTFLGGWFIQLLGHFFEGKRPALTDNILQVFNAPLFLTVEILQWLGLRQELADEAPRAPDQSESRRLRPEEADHQGEEAG